MRNQAHQSAAMAASKSSNRTMQMIMLGFLMASCNAFTSLNPSVKFTSRTDLFELLYKDADVHEADKNNRLDFKQRMRSIAKQQERTVWRPENMKTAVTLQEYANVIEEARKSNSVVVVNFHATWCKKCHSLRPAFIKMASSNPETIYLDVPVTESNTNLHKGLGIESVPYCHIYHPEIGLVEETKISRETLSAFEGLVQKHC